MAHIETQDDQPITVGAVLKWGSLGLSMFLPLVTTIWFAFSVSSDVRELRTTIELKAQQQQQRDEQQDHQISENKTNIEKNQSQQIETDRKLDTALAILNRIDAKLQHP